MTALPNDTSGIIVHDTINNVIDTIKIALGFILPNMIPDTVIAHNSQISGDVIPACDSITYSEFDSPDAPNPKGIFRLKCVLYASPTSINEIKKPTFTIYPNPANNTLTISANTYQFKRYSIINAWGQVIQNDALTQQIDISYLPNGKYYIKLIGKIEYIKPIIKQ